MNLDQFRSLFEEVPDKLKEDAPEIIARNKQYWLIWNDKKVRLCRVTSLNERNIEDIAAWTLRDLKLRNEMEKQNDLLFDARR